MSIYIFIKLIRDPNNNMPLREWSLFMGGGKQSFTLINRGVKKVLTQRKGGQKSF